MFTNRRDVRIEWGYCDPADIVYYPRYFEIFDASTARLIEAATGMTKRQLVTTYGVVGTPMVDTRARFSTPTTYGDDVVVESAFTKIGRSSFDVLHRLLKNGELAVEGFETRVWVARDPDNPDKIKSQPIPQEVVDCFSRA